MTDADRSLFNAQLQLARSQGDVLLQAAALYKSLEGGWVELANKDAPQPAVRLGQRPPLWP